MPMDFPNMQSLINRAKQRNFRQPNEGETESEFREAFSVFMRGVDIVEAMEIKAGRGWDKIDPNEAAHLLINGDGVSIADMAKEFMVKQT